MPLKLRYILPGVAAVALVAVWTLTPHMAISKEKEADKTVVAIVNGGEITDKDVERAVESLPINGQVPMEQLFPLVIDQLINEKLIEEKADAAGLENDPEVLKRLDQIKEQVVRAIYLERQISDSVSDEAVKAEYQKIVDSMKGKKETRARHILVKSEEEAKAIIKELDEGADFAELAKKKSTGPSAADGGDLDYFGRDAMLPEFSDVAFATKVGHYAKEPVKTQYGWHIIYVEDRRDMQPPKLAEVESRLKEQLAQEALDTLVRDLRKSADIKRFGMDGKPLN